MSEFGLSDGMVYLASDDQWYRWPDPTPYPTEEAAHAASLPDESPAPEPPAESQFAPLETPAGSYGAPAQSFDPQAYGPPTSAYGAPGFGAAPGFDATPSGPPEGTNRSARASLLLSIFGAIVFSIPFGIVGLVQTKKTGQKGRRLAIAGLVISAIWAVGIGAAVAVSYANRADRAETGEIVAGGDVSAFDFRVGDCVNGLVDNAVTTQLPGVPCAEPHEGEVFATFELPAGDYPGQDNANADAESGCLERFAAYAGPAAEADDAISLFYLAPTPGSWAQDDHGVTCIAHVPGQKRTGSIKG